MKTKQYVRRWITCRRVATWVVIMTVVLGEAWLMGHFYGNFGSTSKTPVAAEGVSAQDILLAIR